MYEPDAVGLHYAERSFRSWLKAGYAYGRNDVIFGRQPRQARGPLPGCRGVSPATPPHTLVHAHLRQASWGQPASTAVLRRLAVGCSAMHLTAIASEILSGIYNMTYYRGVADELGGADQLSRLLEQGNTGVPA